MRLRTYGSPLWPPSQFMATTLASLVTTPEVRAVLRCEHCSLVQFMTTNALCRRCHRPLEIDEPEPLSPALIAVSGRSGSEDSGLQVARAVRDLRLERNLSQRQLAGRMQVPRTYISKIENGKAMPTLSSLKRLALALEVDICKLVHDARSRRNEETAHILADPFLAEIAPYVAQLDALQKSIFLNQVRDMASGRRKSA
jgi:transcriptional regulator with XRE-family HTH domain